MSLTPTFQGEIQFRRWSDSSTQGVQVAFALPDSAALEPLKGKEGKRFMAVLVEIGDDEQPVQPPSKKDRRGPLCREAQDLCAMSDFWAWLDVERDYQAASERDAKHWLLAQCMRISSRKELDEDPDAARIFVEDIRVPFMRWQRERRKT